ncbi:hypothetical protein ANO11243_084240 [Dothideomycetidae sp. 11243]|nr:hypothetical protein ANO11243_084240 [fungal sp. No.11243]
MGAFRTVLSVIAIMFVGAGIAMQFMIMLSGSSAGSPTDFVYMLQTTTDNIPTLRNPTRWTFLGLCGSDGGPRNVNCGKPGAAPPFDPPMNFATAINVPFQFIETSRFYNLSKAMFGMYLVATLFSVLSFFLSIPALFKLTGAFKGGFAAVLACLLQALAASLMTAWAVEGRNIFNMSGQTANIGLWAHGFAWGAVGAFSIASVLFVLAGVVTAEGPARERREREMRRNARKGIVMETEQQPMVKGGDYI